MIAVVCILILAALYFSSSAVFLYGGKGSWLIAGFVHLPEKNGQNMMKRKCAGHGCFLYHLRRDALSAGISGQSGGTGANGGSAAPALWHRLSCGAGSIGRCCPLYP